MAFDGLKRLRHANRDDGSQHKQDGGNLRKFRVHGSFKHKDEAVKRERATTGAWIIERKQKNGTRYIVLTERK